MDICSRCATLIDKDVEACPCNSALCTNCCECDSECGCSCGGGGDKMSALDGDNE